MSGLVFGASRIVFPCLVSLFLLDLLFDFVCILSCCVYNRKHIAFLLSIKLLWSSKKKRITTIERSKRKRLLVRQFFCSMVDWFGDGWASSHVLVVKKNKTRQIESGAGESLIPYFLPSKCCSFCSSLLFWSCA